jgi:hypothetical protein
MARNLKVAKVVDTIDQCRWSMSSYVDIFVCANYDFDA